MYSMLSDSFGTSQHWDCRASLKCFMRADIESRTYRNSLGSWLFALLLLCQSRIVSFSHRSRTAKSKSQQSNFQTVGSGRVYSTLYRVQQCIYRGAHSTPVQEIDPIIQKLYENEWAWLEHLSIQEYIRALLNLTHESL